MLSQMVDTVFDPRDPAGAPPPVHSLVVLGGFEIRVQAYAGHNLLLDDVAATMACLEGWIS
jgi:hypothetical protein